MILINKATSPDNTIYFIAAIINSILKSQNRLDFSHLYEKNLVIMHKTKVNMSSFTLALDFLFLLNKIKVDKAGKIYVP